MMGPPYLQNEDEALTPLSATLSPFQDCQRISRHTKCHFSQVIKLRFATCCGQTSEPGVSTAYTVLKL